MFKIRDFTAVKLFAAPGSDEIAQNICNFLQNRIPRYLIPYEGGKLRLAKAEYEIFSNGNPQAQVEEVRDMLAIIVCTQAQPVALNYMLFHAMLKALTDADVADVILAHPYMWFSRSDRKNQPRISTFADLYGDMMSNFFGIRRVLIMDPHDSHIKHYFKPAANEITAVYLLVDYLKKHLIGDKSNKWTMVFADAGAANKYEKVANLLRVTQAYIVKDREDNSENPTPKKIIGDVKDQNCLIFDDEILTGGTAIKDAKALLDAGAKTLVMAAVHPILEHKELSHHDLIERLKNSLIEKFITTDSVPVGHKPDIQASGKIIILSAAKLLSEAIARMVEGRSLTELLRPENVNLYSTF
jgi:ribose-phosphate pyrophosphokinase